VVGDVLSALANCRKLTLSRSDLSPEERKDYTDAVLCLQSKPALTSAAAPGAKSRFDDYGTRYLVFGTARDVYPRALVAPTTFYGTCPGNKVG
jgi:hypothetical protein